MEAESRSLELLLPFLQAYGIINRDVRDIRDIKEADLRALALRWGLPANAGTHYNVYGSLSGGQESGLDLGAPSKAGKGSVSMNASATSSQSLLYLLINTAKLLQRTRGHGLAHRLLLDDDDDPLRITVGDAPNSTGANAASNARSNVNNSKNGSNNNLYSGSNLDTGSPYRVTLKHKLPNYFGLPPFANSGTSQSLVYQCRKPVSDDTSSTQSVDLENDASLDSPNAGMNNFKTVKSNKFSKESGLDDLNNGNMNGNAAGMNMMGGNSNNNNISSKMADVAISNASVSTGSVDDRDQSRSIAQRQVAKALLTMAKNLTMRHHFIFKGGIDAVNRLISESDDVSVLQTCMACYEEVVVDAGVCKALIEKSLLSCIGAVLDKTVNVTVRLSAARILAMLSYVRELEDLLLLGGILNLCTTLLQTDITQMQPSDGLIDLTASSANLNPNHSSEADLDLILACNLVTLVNVAISVVRSDAELVARTVMQIVKRLNFSPRFSATDFTLTCLRDISRLPQFGSVLVDESVLPLLLHLIEVSTNVSRGVSGHGKGDRGSNNNNNIADASSNSSIGNNANNDMLERTLDAVVEIFVNLSFLRKNRREIASCGVGNFLDKLFHARDSSVRSQALMMVGNLLNSGYFHDRICKADIVHDLVHRLLKPTEMKQFLSTSFVVSQLSLHENNAKLLMECNCLAKVIELLGDPLLDPAPIDDAYEGGRHMIFLINESRMLLWTMVVNLTSRDIFLNQISAVLDPLVSEIYRAGNKDMQKELSMIVAGNVCNQKKLILDMKESTIECFVSALKSVLAQGNTFEQYLATSCLSRLTAACAWSRGLALGYDLVDILQDVGLEPIAGRNAKVAALLNSISNEQSGCVRLVECGVLKLLVSLHATCVQESEAALAPVGSHGNRRSKGLQHGDETTVTTATTATSATAGVFDNEPNPGKLGNMDGAQYKLVQAHDTGVNGDASTTLSCIAATMHNLSLTRPALGPGVLSMLLEIIKNDKSLRVLHCVRALANLSLHAKAKAQMAKERRLVPALTAMMRCGPEEADKVQMYCAITIANLTSQHMDLKVLQSLLEGTISDLVVVSLLRTNDNATKEVLARAMVNLLCRAEIRTKLLRDLDLLQALLELSRIDRYEVLEMVVRTLLNLSCDACNFPAMNGTSNTNPSKSTNKTGKSESNKMGKSDTNNTEPLNFCQLFLDKKIVMWTVVRLAASSQYEGLRPSRDIKVLMAMYIGNISFFKPLALQMAADKKTSECLQNLYNLHQDEVIFCVVVTLLQLSRYEAVSAQRGGAMVPLLVDLLSSVKNASLQQMCIAAIANLSIIGLASGEGGVFLEELNNLALPIMVEFLSSATLHVTVKEDIVQFLYNLSHNYPACRVKAVECHAISSLWRFLKSQDNEDIIRKIACVVRDLCSVSLSLELHRIVVADGVLHMLLRLSKLEMAGVKADIASAVYSLTQVQSGTDPSVSKVQSDLRKLLQWDLIDVVFWLTLHDVLATSTLIRRFVSRSLRNLSMSPAECEVLVKEERFLSVLKALSKDTTEDVLFQTAVVVYNCMQVEVCREFLLSRGILTFIFDLASCKIPSVRIVCSSCLHIVQDRIPDIDDPAVLELLLCLLDADGGGGDLGERSFDVIAVVSSDHDKVVEIGSPFAYVCTSPEGNNVDESGNSLGLGFTANWLTAITPVDTFFAPAHLPLVEGGTMTLEVKPLQLGPSNSGNSGGTASTSQSRLNHANSNVMNAPQASNSSHISEFVKLATDDTLALLQPILLGETVLHENNVAGTNNGGPIEGLNLALPLVAPAPKVNEDVKASTWSEKSRFSAEDSRNPRNNGVSSKSNGDMQGSFATNEPTKLPKLLTRRNLPNDTLSAIKSSINKTGGGSTKKQVDFANVTINKHSNKIL